MATLFETERLLVRHFTAEDSEHFFVLNSNEEIVRYIRAPKTREECDAFLKEVLAANEANPAVGRWIAVDKASGVPVGSVGIIPVQNSPNMQLGYAFLPEHWGKGYATELAVAAMHYVFTKTDLHTIYAYTETPNLASQKVLLKAGFSLVGTKMEGEKELAEFICEKGPQSTVHGPQTSH
jgi:ribosomal-protein-alanine N-acetyltransferase